MKYITYKDFIKDFFNVESQIKKIADSAMNDNGLKKPDDFLEPEEIAEPIVHIFKDSKKTIRVKCGFRFNSLESNDLNDHKAAKKEISAEIKNLGFSSVSVEIGTKLVVVYFFAKTEEGYAGSHNMRFARKDLRTSNLYNESLKNGILTGDKRLIEKAIKEISKDL